MSSPAYLMASLPMLELFDTVEDIYEAIDSDGEGVLDAPELEALDALLAGEECDDEFVREYQSRETQMRNVSGRLRAQAWGPEVRFAERSFSGYDVTFAKMIQDAFMKSNPLEKEQDIDRARFWLADSLAGVGEGTIKHVYAYAIRICERWARLNDIAGDKAVINIINENDPAYRQE